MSEEEKPKKQKTIKRKVTQHVAKKHEAKKETEDKAPKKRGRKTIEDFRAKLDKKAKKSKAAAFWINVAWSFVLVAWVWAVLFASQYAIAWLMVNVLHVFDWGASENVLQAVFSAITYVIAVIVTIFVPWCVIKYKTTRDELGIRGLPTWTDLLLAPVGFAVFMFVASILLALGQKLFPGINWTQSQDVGFSNLISHSDYIVTFVMLVIVAPIAEEAIFRGWLYGKLRARIPAVPAILLVSILFGIVHGQWNVGVTVFVMSIAMCTIRELTGTIWGGLLIHILKNGIAFYLLYVNPMMIQ